MIVVAPVTVAPVKTRAPPPFRTATLCLTPAFRFVNAIGNPCPGADAERNRGEREIVRG